MLGAILTSAHPIQLRLSIASQSVNLERGEPAENVVSLTLFGFSLGRLLLLALLSLVLVNLSAHVSHDGAPLLHFLGVDLANLLRVYLLQLVV